MQFVGGGKHLRETRTAVCCLALEGVTATPPPPTVSRLRVSVNASSVWDAKELAADGDSEGGRRDAWRGTSGRVSVRDDFRIVTSTDGKRGDVSNSCRGLQF